MCGVSSQHSINIEYQSVKREENFINALLKIELLSVCEFFDVNNINRFTF